MTQIRRTAWVNHSPEQMFDLVHEVEAYPKRFSWCAAACVLERETQVWVVRLDLTFAGLHHDFTTLNTFQRPERLKIHLVDGPFRYLEGEWQFNPLGKAGCRILFTLDFEYAGRLGDAIIKLGFQRLANRMVDDFCSEAERMYG